MSRCAKLKDKNTSKISAMHKKIESVFKEEQYKEPTPHLAAGVG
jgi:hypothetical protein